MITCAMAVICYIPYVCIAATIKGDPVIIVKSRVLRHCAQPALVYLRVAKVAVVKQQNLSS
jgi:hypothetical protein